VHDCNKEARCSSLQRQPILTRTTSRIVQRPRAGPGCEAATDVGDVNRYNYRAAYDDYREVAALFGPFDASQRQRLFSNSAATMQGVPLEIVDRQPSHFAQVDPTYAASVRAAFAPARLAARSPQPARRDARDVARRLLLHLLAVLSTGKL
jgi:catalase